MEKSTKIYMVFKDGKPLGLGNSKRIAYRSAGHIVTHLIGRWSSRTISQIDSRITIKIFDYKTNTTEIMSGRELCLLHKKDNATLASIFGFTIEAETALKIYQNNLCNDSIYGKLKAYFTELGIK